MTDNPNSIVRQAEQLAEVSRAADPTARPLLLWQKLYADWYSLQPERTSLQARRKFAQSAAGTIVSVRALSKLHKNPAFISYVASLQLDAIRRTQAKIVAHLEEGVDGHMAGLRMALDKEDYKALPAFTVPLLDRAMPKRDTQQANTQINVVLTTKQAAQLDTAIPEVSYEVIPPPPGANR